VISPRFPSLLKLNLDNRNFLLTNFGLIFIKQYNLKKEVLLFFPLLKFLYFIIFKPTISFIVLNLLSINELQTNWFSSVFIKLNLYNLCKIYFFLFLNIYRSISPKTMSIVPINVDRSANKWPLINFGKNCKLW